LNWKLTTISLLLDHYTSPLASLQSKSSDEDGSLPGALPPTHNGGSNHKIELQSLLVFEIENGNVKSTRQRVSWRPIRIYRLRIRYLGLYPAIYPFQDILPSTYLWHLSIRLLRS
jgi:hypothetical protein